MVTKLLMKRNATSRDNVAADKSILFAISLNGYISVTVQRKNTYTVISPPQQR